MTRSSPRVTGRLAPGALALGVLALGFLAISLPPYLTGDPATSRVPVPAELPHFYPMLVAHMGFGAVALLTSVAQVWPWLRRRHPRVHRWSGRAYLFAGVLPGGVAVLTVAPFGAMGPGQQSGNVALGLLWLVTGIAGYRAARQRRYAEHRRWMLRSVALTWSIVANRGWLVVCLAVFAPGALGSGPVDPAGLSLAVGTAVWASWLVDLAAVECWLRRRPRPRHRRGRDASARIAA
jgi:uncharacterized membrane protein HdeD (DUF308 family)